MQASIIKKGKRVGERAKMVRAEENPHEKGAMGILGVKWAHKSWR
jgi:hypothetical protein